MDVRASDPTRTYRRITNLDEMKFGMRRLALNGSSNRIGFEISSEPTEVLFWLRILLALKISTDGAKLIQILRKHADKSEDRGTR